METQSITNRITQLFQQNKQGIVSIYFTAGYPQLKDTTVLLSALQIAGADMVEIGIPYSDPLADGPVIQHSGTLALKNGMSLKLLFEQLKDMRNTIHIPVLLMGYLNPVMQYGFDNFCRSCIECGVDGVIIPDLPYAIFIDEYKKLFDAAGISFIPLITPQTSDERIHFIDTYSNGFIYMVSSSSTTGKTVAAENHTENYFKRIQAMKTKNPRMIGFGIHDRESCAMALKYANGAIIGSAFIRMIEHSNNFELDTKNFINNLK